MIVWGAHLACPQTALRHCHQTHVAAWIMLKGSLCCSSGCTHAGNLLLMQWCNLVISQHGCRRSLAAASKLQPHAALSGLQERHTEKVEGMQ